MAAVNGSEAVLGFELAHPDDVGVALEEAVNPVEDALRLVRGDEDFAVLLRDDEAVGVADPGEGVLSFRGERRDSWGVRRRAEADRREAGDRGVRDGQRGAADLEEPVRQLLRRVGDLAVRRRGVKDNCRLGMAALRERQRGNLLFLPGLGQPLNLRPACGRCQRDKRPCGS